MTVGNRVNVMIWCYVGEKCREEERRPMHFMLAPTGYVVE